MHVILIYDKDNRVVGIIRKTIFDKMTKKGYRIPSQYHLEGRDTDTWGTDVLVHKAILIKRNCANYTPVKCDSVYCGDCNDNLPIDKGGYKND